MNPFDNNDPIDKTKSEIIQSIEKTKDLIGTESELEKQKDIIQEKIESRLEENISNLQEYENKLNNEKKRTFHDFFELATLLEEKVSEYIIKINKTNTTINRLLLLTFIGLLLLLINLLFSLDGIGVNPILFLFYLIIICGISILWLKLYKLKDGFNSNELTQTKISVQKIELKKSCENVPKVKREDIFEPNLFGSLREGIEMFAIQCGKTIPLIERFYDVYTNKANWDICCDEIKKSLQYFKIENIENVFKTNCFFLNAKTSINDTDFVRESEVFQHIGNKLKINNKNIEPEILIFLHHYNKGSSTKDEWQRIQNDNELLVTLAEILYNSKLVELDSYKTNLSAFFELLKITNEFNLNIISNNCLYFQRIKEYLSSYHQELEKQQIELKNFYNDREIIEKIHFNEDFYINFVNVFSYELKDNLAIQHSDEFVNPILVILLKSDLNLKQIVCTKATDDDSVIILMVYLDLLKRMQENREEFRIGDLLKEYESVLTLKGLKDSKIEVLERFNTSKAALLDGRWFTDEIFLIRETMNNEIHKLGKYLEDGKKYKIIQKMIKNQFEHVSINIVDKAIDANLFSAYLILTDSSKGKITNLVEKLPDLNKEINGKPKYHFTHYSRGTKIGIIDRDISFSKFKDDFFYDLKSIINSESENWSDFDTQKFGVVILRINPSKYSFGILDDDLEKVNRKNLTVANMILELANQYKYLNLSEEATLAIFDEKVDLLEIINQQTIYDLLDHDGINLDSYKQFLRSDGLKKSIESKISNDYDVQNIKELAKLLSRGYFEKDVLIDCFAETISDEYYNQVKSRMHIKKSKYIASELYNSLNAISTLWDLSIID